jgi:glutaredoxin
MAVSQKRVVLFTAPGCHWCTKAKAFFKRYQINHRTIDISRDDKARQDCERHGCKGVPVIMIGNRWICGFDETKIRSELGIKG